MTVLRLGIAKVDITPEYPITLAGFAHRSGTFTNVAHPLNAKIFAFAHEEQTVLLISADLIWWGPASIERLQAECKRQWGLAPMHVLFHATHTHSGPQVSDQFVPSLGTFSGNYVSWMETRVLQGVANAMANMEPVSVEMGNGAWYEGIHRRKIKDGVCIMAPNPDGPNDPTVTVVHFRTTKGQTKGVLVHATCHPTTTDENRISSEFPGVAMEQVETHLGSGVIAAYLQGFCGDVRPALREGDAFVRGTDGDVRRIGGSLAAEVIRILDSGEIAQVETGAFTVETQKVALRVREIPEAETLNHAATESGVCSEWANLLIQHPERLAPTVQLQFTLVRLADRLAFLAANAEMVVEYGLQIRQEFHNAVLPLGYTNGMIGYVPTARQIVEGGYEASESCAYFGLPSSFDEQIEIDITKAIEAFERG
ncbi:neutral/alkaline non-lysosomal ceramidase N-terminal domain-containing protein [Alicyclobacillus fastidiosus]|uniref:Neutral/alkaline non-lysosomal ceramidase N-terminal domain-containing protein n=1 Tax=Alicyclobacillus fastidiosus TaxID=392011 RepID=A0ABV5AEI5_9BACL|nr:neutral/alkaline non-lysosomal ceramidase N-terminal domain-containing protein [Alicyclobacillus fastidiosus]WEH09752.1 neutral/alkaline non-lysosomal ceramidase N-terminal domain-containing protein [Alicyclobacillus fastidiosus]